MLRGLYTATSGMKTNNRKLEVITNNIANINTVGYKKDLLISESFPEILIKKINASNPFMNNEVFKGVEVKEDNGLYTVNTTSGFFRTKTINGISYQKSLNFTINKDGYLSTYYRDADGNKDTQGGYLVLGNKGPIYVGDGQLEVNERGQVLVDGNVVDSLVMPTPPGVIGTLNSGVTVDKIVVNYEQGQLFETENDLDLGIKGKGFFQIETPDGIRYTRDGSFQLNNNNELVTLDGYPVIGEYGPIVIEGSEIAVSEAGEIIVDGEFIDKIKVINIENLGDLRKEASNFYKMAEGAQIKEAPFTGTIHQGFLEKANVDPIKEMVKMMTIFRNYESGQRVIKAYDDTLGKAVNEVGKV
ncbi:flagellar hook-basal body complex protein [Crassaminicella thermophila]|uniref:Flagellar hook-basal body complex protein n=1 Tax=Crassaminicella thermophila TaxID=2599308 RepID=A0A5C0SJ08_CRATE|nr:flagellar hook-basal body protein [Crassaminicella thermophila]QEK13208.1 flagellar hook-basal body complex protein [Crassaminicella thermophila]